MAAGLGIFKEPRGFIRVIQAVMAIFAFSTTAGFSTIASFIVDCKIENTNPDVEIKIKYPFSFRDSPISLPLDCNDTNEKARLDLPYIFSGSAEFFVATGVIAFLYTVVICAVYTLGHETYQNNPLFPLVDFGVTCLVALFWLAGSSAWAGGVSDLKYYLDPEVVAKLPCICQNHNCTEDKAGSYASLDVSLVFGFANFLLWIGSAWFVYKETTFHQQQQQQQGGQQNSADKYAGQNA